MAKRTGSGRSDGKITKVESDRGGEVASFILHVVSYEREGSRPVEISLSRPAARKIMSSVAGGLGVSVLPIPDLGLDEGSIQIIRTLDNLPPAQEWEMQAAWLLPDFRWVVVGGAATTVNNAIHRTLEPGSDFQIRLRGGDWERRVIPDRELRELPVPE